MSYPPAAFAYAATPTVVPYTAESTQPVPVTLLITINNPTPKFVNCTQLVFSIPVGTGAGALTNNPASITPQPALGVPWTITSDKAGNLTAVPNVGTSGIGAGDSIAFLISEVEVNTLPGLAVIDVWEQSDVLRQSYLNVSKAPPGLAITSFSANPIQVPAGTSTTLSWTTTGAQTCTVSWPGGTKTGLPVDGTLPVAPPITTTYTLTATSTPSAPNELPGPHEGTITYAQLTVYVPQVEILSFSASPGQVPMGGKTTLSWQVTNADTCVINPGNHNVDPVSGNLDVELTESTQYGLAATGFGRTVGMSVWVSVLPVTINKFTATPTEIVPGASSSLAWDTTGASVPWTIDPIGTVAASGTQSVQPSSTSSYELHPQPVDQPHAAATVNVYPGFTKLEGDGTGGGDFDVSYASSGASSVHTQTPGPVNNDVPPSGYIQGVRIGMILTLNGVPLRNRVMIAIASQDAARGNVHSVSVQGDAGLHAIGGTATVSWNYDASAPQGELTVTTGGNSTTTPLDGGTGQHDFVIGDEWSAYFYADATRYPACAVLRSFNANTAVTLEPAEVEG
jgi:hypothetical protein